MKRFIVFFVGFFGVVLTAMLVVTYVVPDPMRSLTYNAGILLKEKRLQTKEGNRLVFAGGSNLAYGLDSSHIERDLGRPVVNMGLHAGLGLRYHLMTEIPYLHKGDVLVVVPEYEQFNEGFYWGDEEVLEVTSNFVPADLRCLSPIHLLSLLRYLPGYACKKSFRLLKFWRGEGYKKHASRWKWNEQGDMVGHWKAMSPVEFSSAGATAAVSRATIEFLVEMKKNLASRGVGMIMLPPCYQDVEFDASARFVQEVAAELSAAGLAFKAEPELFRMESSFMYDTPYHLNGKGVLVRTYKMISVLRECGLSDGKSCCK